MFILLYEFNHLLRFIHRQLVHMLGGGKGHTLGQHGVRWHVLHCQDPVRVQQQETDLQTGTAHQPQEGETQQALQPLLHKDGCGMERPAGGAVFHPQGQAREVEDHP